jgi:CBS domain-containing protein
VVEIARLIVEARCNDFRLSDPLRFLSPAGFEAQFATRARSAPAGVGLSSSNGRTTGSGSDLSSTSPTMRAPKQRLWKDRGQSRQTAAQGRLGQRSALKSYQSFVEHSITAAAILSPLVFVGAGSSLERARQLMTRRGFDRIGVKDRRGRVSGYITLDDTAQRGTCGKAQRLFSQDDLIADSTPLIGVMHEFKDTPRRHLFVLGGNAVTGIITLADLQKPVARVFMFGLLTMLESTMTDCLRQHKVSTESEIKPFLSEKRMEDAERMHERRQRDGLELDFVESLQIADKATVLAKHPSLGPKTVGFQSRSAFDRFMSNVQQLRNSLAHANSELVEQGRWPATIALLEEVEQVIERLEP